MSATQILFINGQPTMPIVGGTQQSGRIGDQINVSGFKIRCLFGQKGDHPNVSWRVFCFSVPKDESVSYNDVFKNITNNVLLDESNGDSTKVVYDKVFRPNQAGLAATGNDEYTFCKKFWIHKRTYKFGPGENVNTHHCVKSPPYPYTLPSPECDALSSSAR